MALGLGNLLNQVTGGLGTSSTQVTGQTNISGTITGGYPQWANPINYPPTVTLYAEMHAETWAIIDTTVPPCNGIILKHKGSEKKVTLEELAVALGLEW